MVNHICSNYWHEITHFIPFSEIQNSKNNFSFFKIKLLLVFSSCYNHFLILHYVKSMSNSLISLTSRPYFEESKGTVKYVEKVHFNINLKRFFYEKNYTFASLLLCYLFRAVQRVILTIFLCKTNCSTNSTLN